jgi:hypothetical protein
MSRSRSGGPGATHTEAIRPDLQGRPYSALAALPPPPGVNTPHTGSIGKRR